MVRRLLIAFNAGLVTLCLAAVGTLGWAVWKVRTAPRVHLPAGTLDERPADEPLNLLLVGSDSRSFVDGGTAESFGTTDDVDGQRADVILLLRVDPATGGARMLSIPRDLWVRVDADGRLDRINAAFEDGPPGLIRAIQDNFGIPVNHYAQVDFAGFQGLVDALGGVRVPIEHAVRDRDDAGRNLAGLEILDTGCVELDGAQALAYVRSRHFEQLVDGSWQPDGRGDIGRIERQQDFLRRAAGQLGAGDVLNPLRLQRLLDVALGHVDLDDRLRYEDAADLARRLAALDPASVAPGALPADNAKIDGKWVLVLRPEEAEPLLAPFRGDPPPPGVTTVPSSAAPPPSPPASTAPADPCH